MKLSINQGPFAVDKKFSFVIPNEHCKEIGNFLWDWYSLLPEELRNAIDVVTVNPDRQHETSRIIIKIIMSGEHSEFKDGDWKIEIVANFIYPHQYPQITSAFLHANDFGTQLKTKVFEALENEATVYKASSEKLSLLAKSIPSST